MGRKISSALAAVLFGMLMLYGCNELGLQDTPSLLAPKFQRSEIFGFLAGLGTTFAGLPDLVAMLKRRSSAGINPRMAVITGLFQILWIYYGMLIVSRPVIAWNTMAALINFSYVGVYGYFKFKHRNLRGS